MNSEPFRQSLFENFIKNYRNTVEFCTIFSLLNVYIFTLAFVYSPAKNDAANGKFLIFLQFKLHITVNYSWFLFEENDYTDNPTFSMLNDTDDEDVIYRYKIDLLVICLLIARLIMLLKWYRSGIEAFKKTSN